MDSAFNVSAVADPELSPETLDLCEKLGDLNKKYEAILAKEELAGKITEELLQEYKELAQEYKQEGFDYLPPWLGKKVGEVSWRGLQFYQKLPDDIDIQAYKIIEQKHSIGADHLAGLLRVSRGSVGRIVSRLKMKGLVYVDNRQHRIILKGNGDECIRKGHHKKYCY